MQQNGTIVPRQTIRHLRPEELTVTNVLELNKRNLFDSEIRDRIGDSVSLPENEGKDSIGSDDFDADSKYEDAFEICVPEVIAIDSVGNMINQQSAADLLINAEILLSWGRQCIWPKCCVVQLMLMET